MDLYLIYVNRHSPVSPILVQPFKALYHLYHSGKSTKEIMTSVRIKEKPKNI